MSGTNNHSHDQVDQKILGEQVKLPFSGKVAKSRFLKAAMTERLSTWSQHNPSKRGIPTPEIIKVYEEWGLGGYGIVLTGNLMVNEHDLEAPGNLILAKNLETPDRLEGFRKLVEATKRHGSLCIGQLSHAGRQVADFIQPHPVSASDVQLGSRMGMTFGKPTPLDEAGIKSVVEQFGYAAEACFKTGFDGVELHGAHGYLLAQFLAKSTNKRTDQYGGSLENRSRIIFEIIENIKTRTPRDFSIGIKLNSVEFQIGGFETDECRDLCVKLESAGVDYVELSGGTYEDLAFAHRRESTKAREAFFLQFADVIRPVLKQTKVYVTGGFRSASAMVSAIQGGSCDGIGLARPACFEPSLPNSLIRNEAKGAKKSLLDQSDFAITNIAAGTQIGQLGRGQKLFDYSDEKQVKSFLEQVGEFMKKMGEDAKDGIVSAGYPILR